MVARAHWMVLFNAAVGICSTGSGTRVPASVPDARMRVTTVFVYNAFVPVTAQGAGRITSNAVRAPTHRVALFGDDALCSWTAWIGHTWTRWVESASGVSVAYEAGFAVALFLVVHNVAVGVVAAGSWLAEDRGLDWFGTDAVRVSYRSERAEADWFSERVALRALTARIWFARVSLFYATCKEWFIVNGCFVH